MTNIKIIIITLLVLVLVGAGGGYFYMEYKVANDVKVELDKEKVIAESVRYSLFNDTLTLKNISYEIPLYPGSKVTVQTATLKKPNLEALNPTTVGMPLVAEQIILDNLKTTAMVEGVSADVTVEQVIIDDWKQNIGKLLEEQKKGLSKELLEASLSATCAKLAYNNISLAIKAEYPMEISLKNLVIQDISSERIGSTALESLKVGLSDPKAKVKDEIDISINSLKLGSLYMPNSENLFYLQNNVEKIISGDASEEETLKLINMANDYTLKWLNSSMELLGLKVIVTDSEASEEVFNLEKYAVQSTYNTTTNANLAINADVASKVDVELFNLSRGDTRDLITVLGRDHLNVYATSKKKFNTDDTDSSWELALEAEHLGKATGKLDFKLPKANIASLAKFPPNEAKLQAFALGILLKSLNINYKDKDLIPKLFKAGSKQVGMPIDKMLSQAVEGIDTKGREVLSPIIGNDGVDALKLCVQKPGELQLSVTSANPLAVTSLVAATMNPAMLPQLLTTKLVCVPGDDLFVQVKDLDAASIKTEGEQKAKLEAEAKAKAEAEQKAKLETEAKAKAEAEQKAKLEADAKAKAEAEQKAKLEAEAKAKAEAEQKAKLEADAKQEATEVHPLGIVVPAPKKPGSSAIVAAEQDVLGMNSFVPDGKADACVTTLDQNASPLIAVRLESMGGKTASWKTKDVSTSAMGVLAVMQNNAIVNSDNSSFSLDVKAPTELKLCVQENGAFADPNTRLRVIFFHQDGSRTYSVVKR